MEEELQKVRNQINELLEEDKALNRRMNTLMSIERKLKHAIFTSKSEDFEKQWGIPAWKVRKDFIQLLEKYNEKKMRNSAVYYIEISNVDKIGGIIEDKIFEISPENMNKCKLTKKIETAFELLKYILMTPLLITKKPVNMDQFNYEIGPDEYKFHVEK